MANIDFKAAMKKPWVKYSLIAVGVIGSYFVLRAMTGGGSSSSGASGPSDAQVQANAQIQAATIAANAAAQQQSAQVSMAKFSAAAGLAQLKADYAGKLTLAHEGDLEQTALANINLQGVHYQLDAQTAQQANSNSTQLSALTAQLNAQLKSAEDQLAEQMHIADNQLAGQIHISDNQAGVDNHQIGATSKSNNTASWLGAAASIAGTIASFY